MTPLFISFADEHGLHPWPCFLL